MNFSVVRSSPPGVHGDVARVDAEVREELAVRRRRRVEHAERGPVVLEDDDRGLDVEDLPRARRVPVVELAERRAPVRDGRVGERVDERRVRAVLGTVAPVRAPGQQKGDSTSLHEAGFAFMPQL